MPSENLTVQDSYTGTASVSLTEATTTTYTYALDQGLRIQRHVRASGGRARDVQTFVGLMEIEAPLGLGVGEIELTSAVDDRRLLHREGELRDLAVLAERHHHGQGTTRTRVSTLQLTGNKETTPAHQQVGARFVPNNTGFALVQSQTADVFALRLAHTGALVAYQMMPNPDIPKDCNIITFPIDPRYTKQGVLDGKVGGCRRRRLPERAAPSPGPQLLQADRGVRAEDRRSSSRSRSCPRCTPSTASTRTSSPAASCPT